MSFLDKAKAKLTEAVDQHGDKIADGIDKAGKADQRQDRRQARRQDRPGHGQGARRPRQPGRQERRHPAGRSPALIPLGSGA